MKIWEIEEGREFREKNRENLLIFLKRDNCIHIKIDDDDAFIRWDISHNMIVGMNFEYLPEKKYYLKLKPEMNFSRPGYDYLGYNLICKSFNISDEIEEHPYKTQFTEKEIKELIPPLWLTICGEPIEVEDEV